MYHPKSPRAWDHLHTFKMDRFRTNGSGRRKCETGQQAMNLTQQVHLCQWIKPKQPFGTSDWRWGGLFSTMDLPRTKLGRSALAIHHAANLQVSTSSHSKRRTACFMQKLPCMVIVHNPHNNLVYNTMVTYHIFLMIHNPMFPATSSNHISHLRLIESHIWSYNFMYQPVFCAILPEFRNIISYNYSLTCIHDKTLLSIIKVSSLQYH